MILAETQAFLQRRREEYMAIEEEIRYILDELLRYDCDLHPDLKGRNNGGDVRIVLSQNV